MKKKRTKWLSFLLAFAIVLSTCTIAFSAFAATPASVAERIQALQNKDDVTVELTNDYKALTNEEKEMISPDLVHKLYNLRYLGATGRTAAQKRTNTLNALGSPEGNIKAGIDLSMAMQGLTPVPYTNAAGNLVEDQKMNIETTNFADENYRLQYAAYQKMWADATEYQRNIADRQAYTGVAVIFGERDASTAVTSNYAALYYAEQQYLGKTPDQIQASFKSFPWSAYSSGYFDAVVEYADVYNAFMQGQMTSAAFIEKVNSIDESKLPNIDVIDLGRVLPFAILDNGQYKSVNASAVFSAMRSEVEALQPMLDFYDLINSIELPEQGSTEFNATVAKVRVAAAELEKRSKYNLETVKQDNPDVFAKYENILTYYYNDSVEVKEIAESHTIIKEETVDYEMARPYGDIITKTLIPSIDSIVNTLIPSIAGGRSLNEFADDLLFTNANVKTVVLMLGNLLGESEDFTPKATGEAMQKYVETAEVGARLAASVEKESGWDAVPDNFDWGVANGDFEGFIYTVLGAVTASPLGGVLGIVEGYLLPNTFEYDKNTGYMKDFKPGLYEKLVIPLLEAFGAENVMDSVTYSKNCPEMGTVTNSLANDHQAIMMVLKQVYDVYARLLADPVGYLSQNLPNIVYHLEDGCIFNAVGDLLNELGQPGGLLQDMDVSSIMGYLSIEGIFSALAPTLEAAGIKLNVDDILKFAHLGKVTVVPSASMYYENTIYVAGNKDSVVRQLAKILEPIALQLLDSQLGFSFDPAKEFVKVESPNYPHDGKMGKDVMIAMINGLDSLLSGIVNLNDTINNALCTPEMAANAITGIYGLLGSLDLSSVGMKLPFTPQDVAGMLTEDKYKDLCAALDLTSWNDVALVVKNGDTVYDIVDMGFKAGDRQGFVDCLVAALRPIVKMLAEADLLANVVGQDGKTESYGLYETVIIPVFEALGVKPAADSVTYTSNFNKLLLRKADQGAAYDYLLKTILSPVLDLVNDVAVSPVSTLMGLLPNLAYAVQYNEDLAFIGNLLAGEDGNIDLAGMLNGLIQGIQTGEDAAGNPVYGLAEFELPAIRLDALASCGQVKTLDSMSQLHKSYTNVIPDKADAFVTVFYYLYDAINNKDNLKIISGLLAGIDGLDPSLAGMIDTILNDVFTRGKEEALCMLGTILASDVWECPDTADENSGKSTPNAGDAGIAAAAVLPVLFAAGAAIILLRKKKIKAI